MLRTNLSTRPFYNERAVQVALIALAAVVVAVTLSNAVQLIRLTRSQRTLGAHAVESEQQAARLRREAAVIRARINPKELAAVANAAREANGIIDQRAFSWTELLGRFEETLPPDVRITAVQPRTATDGSVVIGMTVQARRAEDLDAFIEALEKTGAFRNVTPREEQTNDQGLLEALIEGAYVIAETPVGDEVHGLPLVRRVLAERRFVVLPLAVALVINVVVYVAAVYPLSQRVANIEQRDRVAEEQLRSARQEHALATGTLSGRDRAATELASFYKDVLPADLSGARRLTHLRLAQMARESNLRFLHSSFESVLERNRTLTRLKIEMVLAGTYADMRAFIRQLETAPEFVVIDNLELGEGADGGTLSVTVQLSTYYRDVTVPNGPR